MAVKRTQIEWWIPGGSLVYIGSPKTRLEWIRGTWRGYLGYWELLFWSHVVLMRDYRENASSILKEERK